MSGEFIDIAYKTGAGRYIQEAGALERLGEEVRRLGGVKALIVGGEHSFATCDEALLASLEEAGIAFELCPYAGPCSYEAAERLASHAAQTGCDIIVGVGGGRIMDVAKATAATGKLPLVEVPTSIATCAAYSPLSIMYTEQGAFRDTWRYEREIDAVIVDERVMACQPPRLIAAGILDAMAKVFEIANGTTALDVDAETVQRFSAYEYAKVNQQLLLRFGKQACRDAERARQACGAREGAGGDASGKASGSAQANASEDANGSAQAGANGNTNANVNAGAPVDCRVSPAPTEAIERITFVNLALTGIVSSLTKGYHQTALAHKLYDGLRTLFVEEAAPYLHGELVAIGLLMQVVYNGEPEQVDMLRSLMRDLGMPCSLEEIGIDVDNDKRIDALRLYASPSEFVPDDAASRQRFDHAFASILHDADSPAAEQS